MSIGTENRLSFLFFFLFVLDLYVELRNCDEHFLEIQLGRGRSNTVEHDRVWAVSIEYIFDCIVKKNDVVRLGVYDDDD